MKAPRAIAFDLDGTLVDSRLDIAAACNHVLTWTGRPALDPDQLATFIGDGVKALLARALAVLDGPAPNPNLDAWTAELVAFYAAHPAAQTTWMPGALQALDALAALPLALVTNKAHAVTLRVLEAMGAADRFAFVYAGGDGPLKPHADPVLAAARALSVAPADVWVVGDSHHDVHAAHAAGALAVAVRGGYGEPAQLLASHPDALLGSLAELPPLVASAGP